MTHKFDSPYTLVLQNEYRRMPWKNGAGETLEIALIEDDHGVLFRLSQASVIDNGWFSDFSGMHRTLVLLKGHNLLLQHTPKNSDSYCNNLESELDIARFSGADKTYASLVSGPIDDLNIMVRQQSLASNVTSVIDSQSMRFREEQQTVFSGFYAHQQCHLLIMGGQQTNEVEMPENLLVPADTTVLFHSPITMMLKTGRGVAIEAYTKEPIQPV